MSNEPLRGCPTCGTPVAAAHLGLRDFTWVSNALPGKVAPMDFDFVLERKGKFLIIEFKPPTARLPVGQARTLREARKWADVWLVRHQDGDGMAMVDFGDGLVPLSVGELAAEVALWFEEASKS